MPSPPYDVYREQLTSLCHGHALWDPDPAKVYEKVSIGDVGYTRGGYFVRIFNALLEWDDPSNCTLCEPEEYTKLDLGPFVNTKESKFSKGDYHSPAVTIKETPPEKAEPDGSHFIASCRTRRKQGALLWVPYDGVHKDAIRTKVFEDYVRDHVDGWFSFAQSRKLEVERMEDLIFVTGCTLVTSWGVAAFVDACSGEDAELDMKFQMRPGDNFDWREIHPTVTHKNKYQGADNDLTRDQCVFIRGFRAKRRFLLNTLRLKGAAGPRPDDTDNQREDEIQVTRVPDVPSYRDPLIGVLDYIVEKCQDRDDFVAIGHDDDLQDIEGVDVLTADAVEGFLREKGSNVLIENGVALLQDEAPVVPEEKRATFYASVELEGELVPLVLHPVLSKYFLTLDINTQTVDHDYNLPNEEFTSPAIDPPMSSLKLENHQGYPQSIIVQASNADSSDSITVQDVLRTIHEDLRKRSRRREWNKLTVEERAGVDGSYRERCKSEDDLGQGPCRIDYLRGRDKLQILPRLSPDGKMLPAPVIPQELLGEDSQADESNVAGPSMVATT